jgi:hypothetical protein
MSEIKSAWEIAQEKANRLGTLSAEEREQQESQKYRQIGQALAQKWLHGSPRLNINRELSKYEEKEGAIIKQALIEHLAEVIEITSAQGINGTKKVIEALSTLGPELQPGAEELSQLVQEYQEAEQKVRQELESSCRETLHKLRISGSAIDTINIEIDPKWQPAHEGLIKTFTPRLRDLKQALIQG